MSYKIEVSKEDLQVIYSGLGELPLKFSFNVATNLQRQQREQDTPPDEIAKKFPKMPVSLEEQAELAAAEQAAVASNEKGAA